MNILLAGSYPEGTAEKLGSLLPEHRISQVQTQAAYESLTDAECIIVRILKTNAAVIANNPQLKAVIRWGAGYDSVDIEAAGRQGVLVANTPGVNSPAVAELALALMLMVQRKIPGYQESVRAGSWDRGAFADQSFSLRYKTVGIIGGGAIGRRVASLVQAFGASVKYFDAFRLSPQDEQAHQMEFAPLPELLRAADLVSLHVPLLDGTRHIIGAEQLAQMKPTACLINTARGGLIDDDALLASLKAGRLTGAGLDCVEDEASETTTGLLGLSNVVITPHIGDTTADLGDAMAPVIAEKITSLALTGDMTDVVNRQCLAPGPDSGTR